MTTAADIKDALHRRYNKPSQGREGEQWICLEEARSGAGFKGNDGQCDFLAINTWQSRGMELIGHEVKVSMADWKHELAQPEKAERFARYCRRWFVAVPSALASRIKDEVPPAWGLLSVSDTGRVMELRRAPSREPESVPAWWWVGWLAQVDRQHKRRLPQLVRDGMAEERKTIESRIEAEVAARRGYAEERDEALRSNAVALKKATGIDLQHAWSGNFTKLGEAWTLMQRTGSLETLADQLRRAADALDSGIGPQRLPIET